MRRFFQTWWTIGTAARFFVAGLSDSRAMRRFRPLRFIGHVDSDRRIRIRSPAGANDGGVEPFLIIGTVQTKGVRYDDAHIQLGESSPRRRAIVSRRTRRVAAILLLRKQDRAGSANGKGPQNMGKRDATETAISRAKWSCPLWLSSDDAHGGRCPEPSTNHG